MRFGEALKQVREKYGLSRRELAKKLGVTYGDVWFWEAGRHFPSGPRLVRLFKLFPELAQLVGDGENGKKARKKRR